MIGVNIAVGSYGYYILMSWMKNKVVRRFYVW